MPSRTSGSLLAAILYHSVVSFVACAEFASASTLIIESASNASGADSFNGTTGAIQDGLFDEIIDDEYSRQIAGMPASSQFLRCGMEVPLTDIPTEATIESAILHLSTQGGSYSPQVDRWELRIDGYSGDGQLTLADLSAEHPVGAATVLTSEVGKKLAIDVTAFILELREANAEWAGFTFRTTNGTTLVIGAREDLSVQQRPFLEVQYTAVPEPAAWSLAAIALSLFACRALRVRAR